MEEISQRKAVNRIQSSKKESSLLSKGTVGRRDENMQFCNRVGCSGRMKSNPIQKATIEKLKAPMHGFHPRKGENTTIESSSGTRSSVFKTNRSLLPRRQEGTLYQETDTSEISEFPDEQDALDLSPTGAPPCKNITKSRVGNDGSLPSSSDSASTSSVVKSASRSSRYNIKNLRCDLVSDVIPSVSFSQDSSGKKDMGKKRNVETEGGSSYKGKKVGDPLFSRDNGVLISDPRRSRNSSLSIGSSRTLSAGSDVSPRSRFHYKKSGSNRLRTGSPLVISEHEVTTNGFRNSTASRSRPFPSSPSWLNASSSSGSGANRRGVAINRSMSRDGLWCHDVDGIAEVLMALDRIEQDAGLTYEQLLFLETNILHNGLAFHDQHGDLRMDIDNMSYEELLELEDRMGIVGTPLSEEAFLKCVKRWKFQPGYSWKRPADFVGDNDDIKCSICQEEYAAGDGMGRLQCEHQYHFACIRQWLLLKNWCPICKAPAEISL